MGTWALGDGKRLRRDDVLAAGQRPVADPPIEGLGAEIGKVGESMDQTLSPPPPPPPSQELRERKIGCGDRDLPVGVGRVPLSSLLLNPFWFPENHFCRQQRVFFCAENWEPPHGALVSQRLPGLSPACSVFYKQLGGVGAGGPGGFLNGQLGKRSFDKRELQKLFEQLCWRLGGLV